MTDKPTPKEYERLARQFERPSRAYPPDVARIISTALRLAASATRQQKGAAVKVRVLRWYKPTDHPEDSEDARWMSHGLGGRYAIDKDNLLWWAHDTFTWTQFASLADAKAAAQADFERRVMACLYLGEPT